MALELEGPSLIGAFVGGFVATLTPCVYPLIPITLSIVGAGQEVSRFRAVLKASLYCLGIFICYSLLGAVAVLSGTFFGAFWSSEAFRAGLGVLIIFYSLFSLDLLNFRADNKLTQLASKITGNSVFGAFGAGAVSGILAAPCTGALLATILTLAASSSVPANGFLLLVCYAAGFSLPFFLLSLFPRALSLTPRSGSWLYAVKFLIGATLFTLGLHYLAGSFFIPYVEQSLFIKSLLLLILLLSFAAGVFSYQNESKLLRFISTLVISISIIPLLLSLLSLDPPIKSELSGPIKERLALAKQRGLPIVLDFSADWCIKCKELSRDVFLNKDVVARLSENEFLAIDLSQISEEEKELQKHYNIRGLPAVLFLCPSGKEMPIMRVNEVVSPKEFIARLESAKSLLANCPQDK